MATADRTEARYVAHSRPLILSYWLGPKVSYLWIVRPSGRALRQECNKLGATRSVPIDDRDCRGPGQRGLHRNGPRGASCSEHD